MAGAQSVILLGRLTRDPELRDTQGGGVVVNFGLAVNRKWTNNDGSPGEEVLFIDVAAFGRTAEVVHQYRHKGGEVLCDGYLRLEQWEDRQGGGRRSAIKLVANRIQLIGSDGNVGGGNQRGDGGGWMDRGWRSRDEYGNDRGGQGYGNPPGGRSRYDEEYNGRFDGPPPHRDNRTQQGGRQGSVAGVSYPRRDDGRSRPQNVPQQSRQNARQPAPRQPQRTNAPRDGQGYPESARNDSYGRARSNDLPPNEPGFDPEADLHDNADSHESGNYDGPYVNDEDDGPPAVGHVEPGVAPEMQPLADRFNPGVGGELPGERPEGFTGDEIPF